MRPLFLVTAGMGLALALPAVAQSTGPSSPPANQHPQSGSQAGTSGSGGVPIRQKIQQDLEQAGFKNVQVMPESFLVRAQNKDGQSVLMVINPDSVTAVTMAGGGGTTGAPHAGSGSATGGNATK